MAKNKWKHIMDIPSIEETSQANANEEIQLRKKPCGRPCIYYPEETCSAPNLKFKICLNCPRAAAFIRKNVVQSVFEKIKGLAISLLNGAGRKVDAIEKITEAKLQAIGGAKGAALAAMPGVTLSDKENQLSIFIAGAKAAARAGQDFYEWARIAGVPSGAMDYLLSIYDEVRALMGNTDPQTKI